MRSFNFIQMIATTFNCSYYNNEFEIQNVAYRIEEIERVGAAAKGERKQYYC